MTGDMSCPSPPYNRPEAQTFRENYSKFLSCRESAEVYWNAPKQVLADNNSQNNYANREQQQVVNAQVPANQGENYSQNSSWFFKGKVPLTRSVSPQQAGNLQTKGSQEQIQTFSKVSASDAEFCQLIGAANDGMLARFVENKLNLLCWCRPSENPRLIFGAELSLPRLVQTLGPLLAQQVDPELQQQICIALLDDTAKPVAISNPGFRATWKRPFVATEIGETLPHWEAAVYLLDPAKLSRSAQTLKLTLGLLIAVLVLAIGIGSMLIVADLNRQLTLARQKTDFVSNVSHELKTPLTSIRMFSELLAEGRVNDPAKQRSYLAIITAEASRLTRLINNVLDFARIERGEKKYKFETCDLLKVVRETADTYRPHLEANGFQFDCELPEQPLLVNGDRKQITLSVEPKTSPVPHVEVKVLDRGLGVPDGCAEKIFEQFYRAHDSLSSGIQGAGLGLTLARQIARAHGGDLVYQARAGGGSCFVLRLPLKPA
jgi:signal transduction histidine kinase